jgi:hypothetical protein
MQGILIAIVHILVSTVLLHDEDVRPESQDGVELVGRELVKAGAFPL